MKPTPGERRLAEVKDLQTVEAALVHVLKKMAHPGPRSALELELDVKLADVRRRLKASGRR